MKKTITSNDLKNLVNEAHAQVKDLKASRVRQDRGGCHGVAV